VDAWPALPVAVKAGILAMVKAAKRKTLAEVPDRTGREST
jgi:hypothetical protein